MVLADRIYQPPVIVRGPFQIKLSGNSFQGGGRKSQGLPASPCRFGIGGLSWSEINECGSQFWEKTGPQGVRVGPIQWPKWPSVESGVGKEGSSCVEFFCMPWVKRVHVARGWLHPWWTSLCRCSSTPSGAKTSPRRTKAQEGPGP